MILALVILVVMQYKLSNIAETSTQQGLRYVDTVVGKEKSKARNVILIYSSTLPG